MRVRPVIVVLLILVPAPALGESPVLSGSEVYNGCRNFALGTNEDLFYQGVCAAIIDDLAYYRPFLLEHLSFCSPVDITLGQVVRIVANYMADHPEILHRDFRGIATDALRAAWPCPMP
jgi:hypothetical protein